MTRLQRADALIERRLQAARDARHAPSFSAARARALARFFSAQLALAADIEAGASATLRRLAKRRRVFF